MNKLKVRNQKHLIKGITIMLNDIIEYSEIDTKYDTNYVDILYLDDNMYDKLNYLDSSFITSLSNRDIGVFLNGNYKLNHYKDIDKYEEVILDNFHTIKENRLLVIIIKSKSAYKKKLKESIFLNVLMSGLLVNKIVIARVNDEFKGDIEINNKTEYDYINPKTNRYSDSRANMDTLKMLIYTMIKSDTLKMGNIDRYNVSLGIQKYLVDITNEIKLHHTINNNICNKNDIKRFNKMYDQIYKSLSNKDKENLDKNKNNVDKDNTLSSLNKNAISQGVGNPLVYSKIKFMSYSFMTNKKRDNIKNIYKSSVLDKHDDIGFIEDIINYFYKV